MDIDILITEVASDESMDEEMKYSFRAFLHLSP